MFNDSEWLKRETDECRTDVDLMEFGFIKKFKKMTDAFEEEYDHAELNVDIMLNMIDELYGMAERIKLYREAYVRKRKEYYTAVAREAKEEKEKSAADALAGVTDAFADITETTNKFVAAADTFTAAYKEAVAEGDADADRE